MTDIRQAEGSGAAPGEAGQGHGSVYDRSIAAGNPRKGAEHSTPGRTSSQSIQEALQHVAGGDAPTAVRCGLGPAHGRLPCLAPILITPSVQAAARLGVVVPVFHPARHAASFIESPAPCGRSGHCGINIRQGQRRPPAAPPIVTPFCFPLILYRGVLVSLHTTHVWGAGVKGGFAEDSACNTLD